MGRRKFFNDGTRGEGLPHGATPIARRQPDAQPWAAQQRPGGVQVAQAAPQPPAASQVTQAVVAPPAPSTVSTMLEAAGGSPNLPGVTLSAPVIAVNTLPVDAAAAKPVPPEVSS